ncbi:hypothetical protein LAZ67_22000680 [Cordylochernes scorpioides]|uniref:Reverse transcriptase n=1 Tax=Cordylochernes scorpioides TaxID=51811 RepID=A0ABY6LRF0_9ARAC|nr:hypothetical protein LAZ67_22000680 [Cordylochernes scorpioides]
MTLAERHSSSTPADAISPPQAPVVTEGNNVEPQPGTGKPSTSWADLVEQCKQLPVEEQYDGFILVSHERKRPAETAAERQSKRGRVQPAATMPTVPPLANKPRVQRCTKTLHKQADFRTDSSAGQEKSKAIAVGNVPFFVTDADLIAALKPFGRVTSIVQQMMELDNSCWAEARREAFITLHDGVKISQIPARLDIKTKGVTTPVYVTYGIRCSLCHRQGHKRANCPQRTGSEDKLLSPERPPVARPKAWSKPLASSPHVSPTAVPTPAASTTATADPPADIINETAKVDRSTTNESQKLPPSQDKRNMAQKQMDELMKNDKASEAIDSVQQMGLGREKLLKAFTNNGIMDRLLGKSKAQQRQGIDNLAPALMALTGNTSDTLYKKLSRARNSARAASPLFAGESSSAVFSRSMRLTSASCRGPTSYPWTKKETSATATAPSLCLHRPPWDQTSPAFSRSASLLTGSRSYGLARRRLEDDTARSDYPSLSDLGRTLRTRRRSSSTFTDDDGNAISGGQLRRFLLERLSSRFAQAPSSEEAIADFLAEVTPLEFDRWNQLFLADNSREQKALAIHRLPNGRASRWDGLPCEFVKAYEELFAEVLWQVFEASRLGGALPPSSRRSKVFLLAKSHGGPGLQAFRPITLPTTDYRVLSGVLMARLRRHLPDLVRDCHTYAVPGRRRSHPEQELPVRPAGEAVPANYLPRVDCCPLREGICLHPGQRCLHQGLPASQRGEAGLPSQRRSFQHRSRASTTPPRRILGRGSVVAYADDIVHFIRNDAQFELDSPIFEEFRMASGVAVNFSKSCGLWSGSWRHWTDSPLGIFWTSESLNILGCTITAVNTVASQASNLIGLIERAIAWWSPFVRGLSLVGRARAANCLVLGSILHHLHGYVPPETTIGRLQARLARFLWGTSRGLWLPRGILACPVSEGGVGLLDIAGQLRLACLKGVQASLRGAAKGYSWLVRSRTWMTSPAPDVWLSPRRRRLLSLWKYVYSIFELNHRIPHPASLRSLRLRGDNRFLRPPDRLAPDRWLQATVGDFSDGALALVGSTRAALLDAQHLGTFCQRLLQENVSSRYHAEYEVETIVLRGSATTITRLTSQKARRALD